MDHHGLSWIIMDYLGMCLDDHGSFPEVFACDPRPSSSRCCCELCSSDELDSLHHLAKFWAVKRKQKIC